MHVDGRPKKECTVSRGELGLMYVTRLSTMTMQLPLAQMSNRDGEAGMETMLWDISVIPNDSPRPGWLSCACALHFLARELFHSDVQVNHFLLTTPYPCVTCTYPILSSLLSSTPPRHEYTLNGTWRSHRNLPCGLSLQVCTQYPRPEVFTMTSSFSCMRSPL